MAKVWLSGQIGMAVVQQGTTFWELHISNRHEPQPCDGWVASQIAQHANDLRYFENLEDPPFPEVSRQLYHAWEDDRALRVTLIAIDRARSSRLRHRAATQAEYFLKSERLRAGVRNRLLSAPLPEDEIDSSDVVTFPQLATLLEEIRQRADAVGLVAEAFQALCRSRAFSALNATSLRECYISTGGFSRMVESVHRDDPTIAAKWIEGLSSNQEAMGHAHVLQREILKRISDARRQRRTELSREEFPKFRDPLWLGPTKQAGARKTFHRTALVIGAGPAGLTAALELLRRAGVQPIVLEKSAYMGGISRTVNYRGNRIDIGGHRFFSKSDRVMEWWTSIMPVEQKLEGNHRLVYQNQERTLSTTVRDEPEAAMRDLVMLLRPRQSRIFFLRQLFEYPLKLNAATLKQLGVGRTVKIALSYIYSAIRRIRPERTLEDFLVNRFGRTLYLTFFKGYTEKVWGVPCNQISAEWGAQRIKGLSLKKALSHHVRKLFKPASNAIGQKDTESSLIEKFLYPKYGPGQLWEEVANRVRAEGGDILTGWTVCRIHTDGDRITGVTAWHDSGDYRYFPADYVFSTMPVKELVQSLDADVPEEVSEVSEGLMYRDFITVGLLLDRLNIQEGDSSNQLLKDNWIYIQEPDVLVGRMQIFNNWSPYMVADPGKVWIGLEYFCYDTDDLWKKRDQDIINLAIEEMDKIGIISKSDVLDATVIRMEKTYPAYFGTYDRFHMVREFLDNYHNLFLIGRNGMHKYNNQDHSMLTAMAAVDNIIAGSIDKSNIWAVNTEMDREDAYEASLHTTTVPSTYASRRAG